MGIGFKDKVWKQLPDLRTNRAGHAIAQFDRWVFMAFGSSTNQDVEAAYVNTDATLTPWKVVGTTPVIRTNLVQSAQIGDYWFVAGGQDAGTTTFNTVYSCKVGAGVVTPWVAQAPLPNTLSASGLAASNDHLYFVGGFQDVGPSNLSTNAVYIGRVRPGGVIERWRTGTPYPTPVTQCCSFVHRGYLYVIGGQNDIGSTVVLDDNYRAKIDANGDIGKWEKIAPLALGGRTRSRPIIRNGRLWIVGGIVGVTNQDTIEAAPMTNDGPGTFELVHRLPLAIRNPAMASVGGTVLMLGGGPGSGNTAYSLSL
jgi:hypothetical protein